MKRFEHEIEYESSEEEAVSSENSANSSFDDHRKKFKKLLGRMDDLQAF